MEPMFTGNNSDVESVADWINKPDLKELHNSLRSC